MIESHRFAAARVEKREREVNASGASRTTARLGYLHTEQCFTVAHGLPPKAPPAIALSSRNDCAEAGWNCVFSTGLVD